MQNTDQSIQSFNPSTGELLGSLPCIEPSKVEAVVHSAWGAFSKWKLTSYKEKEQLVLQLHNLIVEQKDELAELISKEVGKPLAESLIADILPVLDACVYFAQNTQKILKDQAVSLNNPFLLRKKNIIVFEPLGVIGIISPWNFPLAIPAITTVMSVLCGNTVVLKPSEKSPLIGDKLVQLFSQAGFPPSVVSVLNGGPEVGAALSKSKVARLIFTGSEHSASLVLEQAAANLTPVTLEAGGKDAAVVLPDAPVEWTARGLTWSAFTNCGQACASLERAYIVRGAHTVELIDQIVEHTKKLKVGSATDPSTEVGPLIDETQLAKVIAQIEEAKSLGAKVLCGGNRVAGAKGHFLEPTVLTNVEQRMAIINEETFGPVLPIVIVDFLEDAIKQVNDSKYALGASIWTANTEQANEIAGRLEAGMVTINDSLFSFACPQTPWGGSKKSGFGRSHSQFGLFELVNIKLISSDTAGGAARFWWYPYGSMRLSNMRAGLDSLHQPSLVGKAMASIRFMASSLFR